MTSAPEEGADAVASASVVRKSVLAVLGWSASEYSENRAMPGMRQQLDAYANVCTDMSARYAQWQTKLMLTDDDVESLSSYVAAYDQENAPETVSKRADHRMAYLEAVYGLVPSHELTRFGELLSPAFLVNGCIPDARAAYVLYRFQDVLKVTVASVESSGIPLRNWHSAGPELSQSTAYTGFLLDKMLMRVFGPREVNRDSLASRLLLNAAINRALLEGGELTRVNAQAAESVRLLVEHLKTVFGHRLPWPRDHRHVREIVERAMSTPADGRWREFKGSALDVSLARAIVFAREDRNAMAGLGTEADVLGHFLLSSLAVAWSYCRREEIDTRQFGDEHRHRQVFNGFAKEAPALCPPGLTRYHQVQFELLHTSGQLEQLNASRLQHQHELRQFKRDMVDGYYRAFKKLTLAQWAKLESELLNAPGREGWADQEPLVAQSPA